METTRTIALAGNPNVGKSTVFNELTGLKQHTGNWPGKTVSSAQGTTFHNGKRYSLVDLPGTYSLMAHSKEEEVARDYICFGDADAVIVVCDATCLERNLNLVLQTLEITGNVVVCVNLMDEASKKRIKIDIKEIEKRLGVLVFGTSARNSGKGLKQMMEGVEKTLSQSNTSKVVPITYAEPIEKAIQILIPVIDKLVITSRISSRWLALRLLEADEKLIENSNIYFGVDLMAEKEIRRAVWKAWGILEENGYTTEGLQDVIISAILLRAEGICLDTVIYENEKYQARDRKMDQILTSKITGIPIMIGLLALVFWITIAGANIPSRLLAGGLFWIEDRLVELCVEFGIPTTIYSSLVFGVYRVLAWVVSVMLPPMAIFFPLFTLLEDFGYLPRIAFNLDKTFKKCCACGKQALTMCMGFGCNAAGVIGCRIIDSPRERLIAILTNNFVPCNGRFPTLIAIITMFFVFQAGGIWQSVLGTALLTCVVLLGVLATFLMSKVLSRTILKGEASSFTLELPPYRKPQIGKVIFRSIFDRTLFVLGRAVVVAAPAGLIIWIFANVTFGDMTLLTYCSNGLEPFARLIGLDGTILFAFILGLPANEIVVPIMIMAYLETGSLIEIENPMELRQLLTEHGWTWITAVSTMLFSLMHWPCSTTLLTIKREKGKWKWVILSMAIPTVMGIIVCFLFTTIARMLML